MLRAGVVVVFMFMLVPAWAGATPPTPGLVLDAGGASQNASDSTPGSPASTFDAPGDAVEAPVAPAALNWPVEGLISFEVLRGEGGIKLGEARHRWEHDGRRYSMTTEVETTGLVGLLYSFRYTQYSEGRVLDSGLQPEHFRVERLGKAPESAHFDWPGGRVFIKRSDGVVEYPISAADQDVLSVWHLFGLLNGRALPSELSLITNRSAAPATLEMIGRELIRLPMGRVEALRIRASARSGRLTIDLWLSERHHLLPVRILMTDDKGEVLDQRALAIELTGD